MRQAHGRRERFWCGLFGSYPIRPVSVVSRHQAEKSPRETGVKTLCGHQLLRSFISMVAGSGTTRPLLHSTCQMAHS